jgi:SPP1 gp7 family putative phage head morphogenesis protein
VTSKPFEGRVLKEWADDLKRADLARIEQSLKIGLVQGESANQIARRVIGTKKVLGRDGVTQITRHQMAAIVRTAVIHVSNQAKREFYKENSDLFDEELYVATLDSRTTPVCRAEDGKKYPIGEGPIPPLHIGCRSLRVALLNGTALGTRPVREFTNKQLLREFSQGRGIKIATKRSKLPYGMKGQFDDFARKRVRELTGTIDAKVTYQDWLGRQSIQFQNDVLGTTRARLFRKGDVTLDRFVNRQGDQIPLSNLAVLNKKAFTDAGLNPEDF